MSFVSLVTRQIGWYRVRSSIIRYTNQHVQNGSDSLYPANSGTKIGSYKQVWHDFRLHDFGQDWKTIISKRHVNTLCICRELPWQIIPNGNGSKIGKFENVRLPLIRDPLRSAKRKPLSYLGGGGLVNRVAIIFINAWRKSIYVSNTRYMTGEIIKNVRRIRKNIGSFLFYIRRRV